MNWKHFPVVLLAGTILVIGTTAAPAHGLRGRGGCGAVAGGGGDCAMSYAPCAPAPCAPAPAPVMQKVMVTEYQREEYETTVKVWKTFTKEEKYTAYKCEVVPVQQKVTVTRYINVPKEIERVVTRCELQPVTVEVPVTRYVCVPTEEERTVIRCSYVPKEEEREVTRYEMKTTPVTTYVSRCVEAGGHYECREVACSTGGGRHGLLHRRHEDCGCPPPVSVVSVYVPNYVTQQVPVTTYQCVCVPHQEKVKFTVYQRVETPEKIKVTVNKMRQINETVKVTRCQLIEKKETVKMTVYECVAKPTEEMVTVYQSKTTPYEMTRMVCYQAPVEEKVKAIRYVPKTVEREVAVYPPTCAAPCDYVPDCGGGRRHGLFRH